MVIDEENSEDLELTDDDPYAGGYYVEFDDGTQLLQREIEDYQITGGESYREIGATDELTQIAFAEYNNSKQWWEIADANKIFNPFNLEIGSGIIIPDILPNQS